MKDQPKTKQALIQELVSLRHRISELERSESEGRRNLQFKDKVLRVVALRDITERKRAEEALRQSEENTV